MSQMFQVHRLLYPNAFACIRDALPKQQTEAKVWPAFVANSTLTNADGVTCVTMDAGPPLIFPNDLGPSVWSQFDPEVPGRIEISIDVLRRFEDDFALQVARDFLIAKVLHEMSNWGGFQHQAPQVPEPGIAFEDAAYGNEIQPWYLTQVPAAAVGAPDPLSDPAARASLLQSLLSSSKAAPGRADDPSGAIFAGVDASMGIPRGLRNSNPGNIRINDPWLGLADPNARLKFQQQEQSFCVFREPEWGLRAVASLMRTYKHLHGLDTPRKIISRWAPASDNNDVESYAQDVATQLGLATPDSLVDADDDAQAIGLMKAIARHENGVRPPYAEVQYKTALLLL